MKKIKKSDILKSGLTNEQEAALKLMAKMLIVEEKFESLNEKSRELMGDFYPHQKPIADCVETEILALLDSVLDNMPSYFLYECGRNGSVSIDGKTWKIGSVDDIANYMMDKNATQADGDCFSEPG